MNCIFCKIKEGKIPAKFIFEDEDIVVFPNIHPVKPIHWLIMPKKHIPEFVVLEDQILWKKLLHVVQKMVDKADLKDKGYKIVINGGGHQDVDHLHIHLLGPMRGVAGGV